MKRNEEERKSTQRQIIKNYVKDPLRGADSQVNRVKLNVCILVYHHIVLNTFHSFN